MDSKAKTLRVLLFAVGGVIGLLLLTGIAFALLVDANSYKSRIEAAASQASGMKVAIEGNVGMSLSFSPGLRITLENVRVQNRGTDLAG